MPGEGDSGDRPGAVPQRISLAALFDADWYARQYPDVSAEDRLEHYLTTGWREGRDPGPLFDSDWYLAVHPAAEQSGENPLLHFLTEGCGEGLRPNPLFDPTWYRLVNRLPSGQDSFAHYVLCGRRIGLHPGPAVAAAAQQALAPPCTPSPTVTVVIPSDDDFIHADRCVRALSRTEAHGCAEVIVVADPKSRHPWQRLSAWARIAPSIPSAGAADYLLVLRPDAEPMPGFLHALIAAHRSTYRTGTAAACPHAHPTLAAPAIPSDWEAITTLPLPPQGALVSRADWAELAGGLDPHDVVRAVADRADVVIHAPDSRVLSHRPMAISLRIKRELRRWDPDSMARLVLLTAQADRPVAVAAAVAWLQLAECDVAAATTSLGRWRTLLAALPGDTRAALPRLVRRRDQLVADIIHESMLNPMASEKAGCAVAAGDLATAIANLTRYPDSYPAAVAVMALIGRRDAAAVVSRIPREIVQGWFDTPMPPEVFDISRSWPEHHPGWRYRFFDTGSATTWIAEHLGPDAARVFASATPVGKSNLFRYAYLAESGGVWSDTDDRCLACIEPVVDGSSFVVVAESIGAIADNFIAVAPGHPALIATRGEAFRNVGEGFAESPWLANGPGLFTRKVAAWAAGMIPGDAGGIRVLTGAQIARYVAMHEQTDYKETTLAWDVPVEPVTLDLRDPTPLSRRQRDLERSGAGDAGPTPSA